MDKVVIPANRREVIGKKVKVLRREGKLPAIIYGYGIDPLPIVLDLREITKILREVSRATILEIDVDGEKINALLRDRQRGILSGHLEHIDFLAISMTETVTTQVNVFVVGTSPAEEEFGAIVMSGADSVEVEALPADLPESLTVDVSNLTNIGDTITVADLELPSGVNILAEPSEMLAVITLPAQEIVEEEEEDLDELDLDLEPELVGEEDEEGEIEDEE
ncbi:MAG TPA: 50S ribosomal protein L25 [Anaerolineales bacterium]|nr:50S ribosomal protein L25 [Anaerolineales bacterium]